MFSRLDSSSCCSWSRFFVLFAVAFHFAWACRHQAAADEVYQPNSNPPTDGRVGSNYTPAYAVNQVQFWHDFRPEVVNRELAAARRYFGISTLRVYLHDINFFEDRKALMANLEAFLAICAKHDIQPGFVFFDSCHRHQGIYLDRPTEPVRGFHNSRWAQSPQARHIDKGNLEKFKPYVQEIVAKYRDDDRVLFWEIHNEPAPGDEYRDRLKRAGYAWAKEIKPIQPVINCEKGPRGWADCEVSDIVDAHQYLHNYGPLDYLAEANPEKGTVITEAGARWKLRIRNFGDPCEMIHWLEGRRARGKSTPGVYLCWELMVGNSNCRWHWRDSGHTRGAPDPEPEIPWCGLMWPDCTPVSLAEAEAIRRYTTGKSQALLYSNFEHSTEGWEFSDLTEASFKKPSAVNALHLPAVASGWAGDKDWTDYVLEGTLALQPDKESDNGRAGFVLREQLGPEGNQPIRNYEVAITTDKQLVLNKTGAEGHRRLASFDLTKLDTKSRMGEWSMIRVAVSGPRIRVWCNRMPPSVDPARGLRIDYTDKENPIHAGHIGIRTLGVRAAFDNVVVLPIDALPGPAE